MYKRDKVELQVHQYNSTKVRRKKGICFTYVKSQGNYPDLTILNLIICFLRLFHAVLSRQLYGKGLHDLVYQFQLL